MVELNRNFKYAIRDLVWLLNKGYSKKPSIDLVGNRYMLNRDERLILLRGVFNKEECKKRRMKLMNNQDIKAKVIIIDGLNVLISIHSYLMGRVVFRALDGYVRDISGIYGNFTYEERTKKAFELLVKLFTSLLKIQEKEVNVYLFLDYKVSKVGDFAQHIRGIFFKKGIYSEVVVDRNCDFLIVEKAKSIEGGGLVATSDTVIINKVDKIIDIPSLVIEGLLKKKVMDLKKISGLRSIG